METIQYFEKHRLDIYNDLRRLVNADSPSNNKELLTICKDVLQSLFYEYFKYRATEIKMEQTGDHLRFEVGEGTEQILLIGHYDTVWEPGTIYYRETEDKIYGPGVLDMKGSLISAIWMLKYIQEHNFNLKRRIVFIINSDEEIGSLTSRALIESEAKKSIAALVLEPPVAKTGELKTARKGTSRYMIDIKGVSAHAGNNPQDGVSAIHEAAELILDIENLTDYEKGTTLNVGIMEGGGKLNVIPNSAHLGVDVRSETREEQLRIDNFFEELQAHNERIELEVVGGINRPPMEKDAETEDLFYMAQTISEQLGFQIEEAEVGGASDGNFAAQYVATLDGLGLVGDGMHNENEHIVKAHIFKRFALLTNLVLKLAHH